MLPRMTDWLSDPQIWISLLTLTGLEIVLGIDNIIFLAILAGKLPEPQQPKARRIGLIAALGTRLLLLATLSLLVACFNEDGPRERIQKPFVLLASLFTGFALVTKAPGVLLLPIGGMVLLGWAIARAWQVRSIEMAQSPIPNAQSAAS